MRPLASRKGAKKISMSILGAFARVNHREKSMKYAFCNEMFGDEMFEQVWPEVAGLGYTGVEIAPFTLWKEDEHFDARAVPSFMRQKVKQVAADSGLEVVGLHWLLAKTSGFYLTSPDAKVRSATADYIKALVELCADLGGKIMVLGSPQQRNLLPGVGYNDAEQYAAEVLRSAMPSCEERGVKIALEPLGPAEGDFMLTAETGIRLAKLVDSPNCKLHLDVKAMSSEPDSIPIIIERSKDWMVHFHANDPNLLGPGMGKVEFGEIFQTLHDIKYDGWVSVEVFKYEPSPMEIARQSIEYMQKIEQAVES
jgi:sugar phosphate isomerase/epimerase